MRAQETRNKVGQSKSNSGTFQRQAVHFKDNRSESSSTSRIQNMANASIQMKPNNTGLPNHLKSGIESLSGHSMDDVKVHYNSSKPAQLNAHAYAQGTNIHVASGQEKHVPHEAWHVVQQKQGRVQPTRQMKGKVNINDDAGLEKEADVMGAKALQMVAKLGEGVSVKSTDPSNMIQLKPADWNSPKMTTILGIAHGYFSTWKKIKAEIRLYQVIPRANKGARDLALKKIRRLITEWKADDAHSVANENARIRSIKVELPYLESMVEEDINEIKAEGLEARDSGHSLDRHGPELTNSELEKRLYTGIAPDDKISPSPGSSSKFKNHTAWVNSRNIAAATLRTELSKIQVNGVNFNTTYATKATVTQTTLGAWQGPPVVAANQGAFYTNRGQLKNIYGDAVTSIRGGLPIPLDPKKNVTALKTDFETAAPKVPVFIVPAETKDVGELNSIITTFNQYSVHETHTNAVGGGVEKTGGATEITFDLAVLLPQIATWTVGADWSVRTLIAPQPHGTIEAELVKNGVPLANNAASTLATFFTNPININAAKDRVIRHKKDVKIYDALQPAAAALNQTYTTFQLDTRNLFKADNTPKPCNVAAWKTVQHYPASGLTGPTITKGQN